MEKNDLISRAAALDAISTEGGCGMCARRVLDIPTVDAIPVEWLIKRRDIYLQSYHAGHECDLHTAAILNDLIVDWRKEHKA